MGIFDDIPDEETPQPASPAGNDAAAENWMMRGTSGRTDPTQLGFPVYYDDLPEMERNKGPKDRSLSVLANQGMLGYLPYARAGAEAQTRGESYFGGTDQYERQRKALQQYYNDAYEASPDAVKVLGGVGLPGGPMAQAGKYLTSAARPIVSGAAMGAGQAGVAGYLAPVDPATGDWQARALSAAKAAPFGALLGGGAGAVGKAAQSLQPQLSTPAELAAFHEKAAETAPAPSPFSENARAAAAIHDRGRLIEDQRGAGPVREAASEVPPEKPGPAGDLFGDIPDEEAPAQGQLHALSEYQTPTPWVGWTKTQNRIADQAFQDSIGRRSEGDSGRYSSHLSELDRANEAARAEVTQSGEKTAGIRGYDPLRSWVSNYEIGQAPRGVSAKSRPGEFVGLSQQEFAKRLNEDPQKLMDLARADPAIAESFDPEVGQRLEAIGKALAGPQLHALAGERGAENLASAGRPAAKEALDLAAKLDAEGKTREEIWQQTADYLKDRDPAIIGAYKGVDGKWRVEIDDSGARFNMNAVPEAEGRLGQAARRFAEQTGEPSHRFANPRFADETKHDFTQQKDAELARDAMAFRREMERQPRGTDLSTKANAVVEQYKQLGIMDWLPSRDAMDVAMDYGGNPSSQLQEVVSLYGLDKGTTPLTSRLMYKRLAGENESRNVQSRMNVSAEERRATPPWQTQDVPDEQQIIRYGNRPAAEQLQPAERVRPILTPETHARIERAIDEFTAATGRKPSREAMNYAAAIEAAKESRTGLKEVVEQIRRDPHVSGQDAADLAALVGEDVSGLDKEEALGKIALAKGYLTQENILAALARGEVVPVPHGAVQEAHTVLQAYGVEIPPHVTAAALTHIEPIGGEGGDKARLNFSAPDGRTFARILRRSEATGFRAAYFHGNRSIGLAHTGIGAGRSSKSLVNSLAGQVRHETIHALRHSGLFTASEWRGLVAHAENLQILDVELRHYLERVGDPNFRYAREGVTVRDAYEREYNGAPDFQELLDQEAVAHAVELYHHMLTLPSDHLLSREVMPRYREIEPILEKMFSGEIAARDPAEVKDFDAGKIAAITVYHGGPHDFDRFDSSKIGTGEGAQAFGHGLYFAQSEGVARSYQQTLGGRVTDLAPRMLSEADAKWKITTKSNEEEAVKSKILSYLNDVGEDDVTNLRSLIRDQLPERLNDFDNIMERQGWRQKGRLYEVSLDVEPHELLDWDKPLSEQPEGVREKLNKAWLAHPETHANQTGAEIYRQATLQETNRIERARKEDEKKKGFPAGWGTAMSGYEGQSAASKALHEIGIPGIRYADAGSRRLSDAEIDAKIAEIQDGIAELRRQGNRSEEVKHWESAVSGLVRQKKTPQSHNFVIFPGAESRIKITAKDGKPVSAEERADVLDQSQEEQKASYALSGTADRDTGRSMRRDLDKLGYYSAALEDAKGLKQAKGTPEQMLAQLRKGGAKDAEIDATKLRTFLEGKKSVTRDEIVRHLEENRVGLNEVTRALLGDEQKQYGSQGMFGREWADLTPDEQSQVAHEMTKRVHSPETKWQDYSLDPNNPSYRETVLHLPEPSFEFVPHPTVPGKFAVKEPNGSLLMEVDGKPRAFCSDDPEIIKNLSNAGNLDRGFQSGHFPEPNITGHMMTSLVKDEQGKPVFLLDQIQSDWGQGVRDKGVKDETKIAGLKASVGEAERAASRETDDLMKELRAKGWPENASPVGWANEHAPELAQRLTDGGSERANLRLLRAELKTAESAAPGHPLVNTTDQWVRTTLRRAIAQAVESGASSIAIPSGDTVLSYNPGNEHGMREFYGKIVPLALKKLMRGQDAAYPEPQRVEKLETPSKGPAGKGFTVFPITDAVRASVARGQPLFARGGAVRRTSIKEAAKRNAWHGDPHARAAMRAQGACAH